MRRSAQRPPPMLMGYRVTHFLVRDKSIKFSGRSYLFVDGKELGAVPRLAIGAHKSEGYVLFHCGSSWNVRGTEASFDSVVDIKRSVARIYPGSFNKWRLSGVTIRQAEAFRRRVWKGLECSFCGKLPDEFERMVESKTRMRLCNICFEELRAHFDPAQTGSRS